MLANPQFAPFNVMPPVSAVHRPGFLDPTAAKNELAMKGFAPSVYTNVRPEWAVRGVAVELDLEERGRFTDEAKYVHGKAGDFYVRVQTECMGVKKDTVGMVTGAIVVKPGAITSMLRHYSPDHCFALMKHAGNPVIRSYHMKDGWVVLNEEEVVTNPDVLLVLDSVNGWGFSVENTEDEDVVVSFRFVARTDQVYHVWRILAAFAERRVARRNA